MAAAAAAFGAGSYADAVMENWRVLQRIYFTWMGLERMILLGYGTFLVTMLLGLLAGRHGWIQRAAAHVALVRRVQWWGLGIGIGAGVLLAIADRFTEPATPSLWAVLSRTSYSVSRVALMISLRARPSCGSRRAPAGSRG